MAVMSSLKSLAATRSLKDLPDGFRLNPRDEDLANYYLRRKLQNIPDPDGHCLIPELNIYLYEPPQLIAVFDEMASIKSNGRECFFFCTLDKDPNRGFIKRKIAEVGFWNETCPERKSQTDKLEWTKRIFSYRVGKHRNFKKTDWVMHEFGLSSNESFVLCRITKKPKKLSASAGKKRKVGSTDDSESHQETSPEVTKRKPRNKKPKKMFSASAGKKPKDGSTYDKESHQEKSHENCVLIFDDTITKKAKNRTGPSQNDNQTPPQVAGSEVQASSVHINAIESPLMCMTTLEDIFPSIDFEKSPRPPMDEFVPLLDDCGITLPYAMDIQTPPDLDISDYHVDILWERLFGHT